MHPIDILRRRYAMLDKVAGACNDQRSDRHPFEWNTGRVLESRGRKRVSTSAGRRVDLEFPFSPAVAVRDELRAESREYGGTERLWMT